MQSKTIFFTGASAALLLSASAQTFSLDNTGPDYDPSSYRHINDYVVGEVSFNNTTGPSSPYSTDPVGFKRTTVVTPAGVEIDVWDACAELFVGPTGGSTYTVTPGLSASGWNATQIEQVETLYSNALVLFTGELGDYDAARPFGAAIQMALWEIAEETAGTLDLDTGNFNVASSDIDTATTDAIDLATQWISNIQNGTWTNQPGVNLFYADSAGEQDRLWAVLSVTPTSLPEPSTALFTLIGGALLVSRRRR